MEQMFDRCGSLTSLNLGSQFDTSKSGNVQEMFAGCNNLTTATVGSMGFYSEFGMPADIGTFYGCENLSSVTIGSGITRIDDMAFCFDGKLSSITIKATTEPYYEPYNAKGVYRVYDGVANGGTFYYPKGSDYSLTKSITTAYMLGYKGWNFVEVEF
jgi:surface protein